MLPFKGGKNLTPLISLEVDVSIDHVIQCKLKAKDYIVSEKFTPSEAYGTVEIPIKMAKENGCP